MNDKIYKCTIGSFGINDAFTAVDLLAKKHYQAISCLEKNSKWSVEILHNWAISIEDIQNLLQSIKYDEIVMSMLKNENWLKKCFENFKPIIVGKFFIFGNHLRNIQKPANKIKIEIAAATAFGTGEHATTNRCLMACQTFYDSKKHGNVLDIGCGSAILSIALAKLGAKKIFAYDNDPEAVKISKENCVINKVAHRVQISLNKSTEFTKKKYDFIVANILAEPLISLSNAIVDSLNDKGILVLSGFTANDDSVFNQYLKLKLTPLHKYEEKEWATIIFKKKV